MQEKQSVLLSSQKAPALSEFIYGCTVKHSDKAVLHIFKIGNILRKTVNLLSQNSRKSVLGFILCCYMYQSYLAYKNISKSYKEYVAEQKSPYLFVGANRTFCALLWQKYSSFHFERPGPLQHTRFKLDVTKTQEVIAWPIPEPTQKS